MITTQFSLPALADGTLTIGLQPAVNISGWTLQCTTWKNQQTISGSVSGLITKSAASGFNNVSGINVTNGAGGVLNVNFNRFDVSGGLEVGTYYFLLERLDSGNATPLANGLRLVKN